MTILSQAYPYLSVMYRFRDHWMVERYHRHLDVTFKEDNNRTIDKQATF